MPRKLYQKNLAVSAHPFACWSRCMDCATCLPLHNTAYALLILAQLTFIVPQIVAVATKRCHMSLNTQIKQKNLQRWLQFHVHISHLRQLVLQPCRDTDHAFAYTLHNVSIATKHYQTLPITQINQKV